MIKFIYDNKIYLSGLCFLLAALLCVDVYLLAPLIKFIKKRGRGNISDKAMVFDHHIHIGQYWNAYFYPDRVIEAIKKNGILECNVSSTTSNVYCKECHPDLVTNPDARSLCDAITEEVRVAVETGKEEGVVVHPYFWVVPDFEKCGLHFEDFFSEKFLYSKSVKYEGFKIHPRAQNWDGEEELALRVFAYASKNGIPVMIHTGDDVVDSPKRFEFAIKKYPKVKVQLAHIKSEADMFYMLKKYPNVWADNSSTPQYKPCKKSKILYGKDFPMIQFKSDREYEYSAQDLAEGYSRNSYS